MDWKYLYLAAWQLWFYEPQARNLQRKEIRLFKSHYVGRLGRDWRTIMGSNHRIVQYFDQIFCIISKLFQWFVATIIIIAKNFEILQFRGKIFCNNDDYCNEWLKKFWYNGRYLIVSSAIMVGSAAPPNNYCTLAA